MSATRSSTTGSWSTASRAKGAIFVDELDQVPDGVPVVFSAHGVPKAVPAKAAERGLSYLDATCPLVSKVHRQAERLVAAGRHILFIGHAGHPEVIGTFGQVPEGAMTLVETVEDAEAVAPADPGQPRLPHPDDAVGRRYRGGAGGAPAPLPRRSSPPAADDICYATSNRQAAVKAIAETCDLVLVIGAPNSSNSLRLAEVAERHGTPATLIQRAAEIDFALFEGVRRVGISAGASAPELLVREVVECIAERFAVTEREVATTEENIVFKLPRGLEAA
ncbi:MAG: 4-hydroxy-3-methylbut-2-enyl diphosphate reductase [Sphingomonas sp.]